MPWAPGVSRALLSSDAPVVTSVPRESKCPELWTLFALSSLSKPERAVPISSVYPNKTKLGLHLCIDM